MGCECPKLLALVLFGQFCPENPLKAEGYLLIRKIITHVHQLLQCPPGRKGNIKVEHILVCPNDGLSHQWVMPGGWDQNTPSTTKLGKASVHASHLGTSWYVASICLQFNDPSEP